jgi:hypothetical protein
VCGTESLTVVGVEGGGERREGERRKMPREGKGREGEGERKGDEGGGERRKVRGRGKEEDYNVKGNGWTGEREKTLYTNQK